MSPLDELETLLAKATPGPWRTTLEGGDPEVMDIVGTSPKGIEYVLGTIGGYFEEDPDPETGLAVVADNSPDAHLIVAAVNAAPTLVKLTRIAGRTLAASGPLTFTGPGEERPRCLFCGAPVDSGDCCLDEMRAVLRELTQERSPV